MNIRNLLLYHEGYNRKLRKNSFGRLIIGVGYDIEERGLPGDIIKELFHRDVTRIWRECKEQFPWWDQLSAIRQEVLLDMCYCLGIEKLSKLHKLLNAVAQKDYEEAARCILDSEFARRFRTRAYDLAQAIRTNNWNHLEGGKKICLDYGKQLN